MQIPATDDEGASPICLPGSGLGGGPVLETERWHRADLFRLGGGGRDSK